MYLFDEHPIIANKTLAREIGLNEALILQQINYWIEINNKSDNNFKGRLKIIKDYCTISTKQMRVPNAGMIALKNAKYRYLTERECFRLKGFTDDDFDKLRKVYPEKRKQDIIHFI